MFTWLKRQKYQNEVLEHVKTCMLIDPRPIYPQVVKLFSDGFSQRTIPAQLAAKVVCAALISDIEKISDLKRRQEIGTAVLQALNEDNAVRKFAAEAVITIKANMKATGKPVDMNDMKWRIQFAMIGINTLYDNILISTDTRNWFYDEIGGALDGQTAEQRAAERQTP